MPLAPWHPPRSRIPPFRGTRPAIDCETILYIHSPRGFPRRPGSISPPLEVHRPALPDQQGMDPAVTVTRMSARQAFDLLAQGRLVNPSAPAVPQNRARSIHDSADPTFRDPVPLAQIIGGSPLLVGAHHFFFAMSWSICLSSRSSATSRLRRSTSSSHSRLRR